MRIIWNPNPLATVVELDKADRTVLWHRVKIERLEEKIGSAYFDLDAEHGKWLESIGKGRSIDVAVAEALRHLDYAFISGDEKRRDKSFDEYIEELTQEYVQELASVHVGDCTCVACSCLKCHAETLVGVDTIRGLGKHEASYVGGAFEPKSAPPRTLDEVIAHLADYEPKDVPDWGIPHVTRWREEGRRAHEWLIAYRREHFTENAPDAERPGNRL
jgi:hypothetical protein